MKPDDAPRGRGRDEPVDGARATREHERLLDQHRDASRTLDERPSAAVRARVLSAAKEAQVFQRARRDTDRRRRPAKPAWPRSAAVVLMVAVLTGLVASRGWDRIDAGAGRGDDASIATTPRPMPQPAPSPPRAARGAAALPENDVAAARERSLDHRSFSRERSDPPPPLRRPAAGDTTASATRGEPRGEPTREPATAVASSSPDAAAAFPATPAAAERSSAPLQAARADAAPAQAPPLADAAPDASAAKRASTDERLSAAADAAPDDALDGAAIAWANRIVALRLAGDDDHADQELRRLKTRYPRFPVPFAALRAMPR